MSVLTIPIAQASHGTTTSQGPLDTATESAANTIALLIIVVFILGLTAYWWFVIRK